MIPYTLEEARLLARAHLDPHVQEIINFLLSKIEDLDWKPIETAPKDDWKPILGHDGTHFLIMYWAQDSWMAGIDDEVHPTHWMPLPERPTTFPSIICPKCKSRCWGAVMSDGALQGAFRQCNACGLLAPWLDPSEGK